MRNQHWVIRYPAHGLLLRILKDFRQIEKFWNNMIDLSESSLTPSMKEEFYELLAEYKKYFSLYDELGLVQENGNQFRVYRQLSVKRKYENKDEQRDE